MTKFAAILAPVRPQAANPINSGLQTTEESPRGQNLDAKGLFQFEQVRIPSDDEFRPCSQCASKVRIVAGVAGTLFPSGAGETSRERPISPSEAGHGERRNFAPFNSIFVKVERHSSMIAFQKLYGIAGGRGIPGSGLEESVSQGNHPSFIGWNGTNWRHARSGSGCWSTNQTLMQPGSSVALGWTAG